MQYHGVVSDISDHWIDNNYFWMTSCSTDIAPQAASAASCIDCIRPAILLHIRPIAIAMSVCRLPRCVFWQNEADVCIVVEEEWGQHLDWYHFDLLYPHLPPPTSLVEMQGHNYLTLKLLPNGPTWSNTLY